MRKSVIVVVFEAEDETLVHYAIRAIKKSVATIAGEFPDTRARVEVCCTGDDLDRLLGKDKFNGV